MRVTVGMKIALGFLVLLLVIVGLAGVDTYADRQVEERLERLYARGVVGSQRIGNASAELHRMRSLTFQHIAAQDEASRRQLEQRQQEVQREFLSSLQSYRSSLPADDPRRNQLDEIRTQYDAFIEVRDTQVLPASRAEDPAGALDLQERVNGPRFAAIVNAMDQLEQVHLQESEEVYSAAQDTLRETNTVSRIVSVCGIVLAWVITRNIGTRIRNVSEAASRIGRGDLAARAEVSGSDEITDLAVAFNQVTVALAAKIEEQKQVAELQSEERTKLADSVRTYGTFIERVAQGELTARLNVVEGGEPGALGANLESMGEALRNMTLRIHQAVGALSSATSEIGTTVQEHATSANETASAVAETAATVDEVQQSAERVTEHARHVHEVSRRSVEVSAAGRHAVEHTVGTMQDVRQQVDGIAGRILSLSEQTQAVGHIITSVNELAEQSNLLALNAAIEAARAGEAGAGFGVVAQEIRALADQSKDATSHVRSILGDIQKSTTEAVLATEEGSKAVARAVDAVRGAGDRIEQLAASIAEAARAAEHILTAAQQQAQGVGQISQAIHSIDAASRQTVGGTRIIESASRDLNQLAGDLRDAVAQYRA